MFHDSTWLRKTRAGRIGLRPPLGPLLACVLMACVLLMGFAATALASGYEIRGEWKFTFVVTNAGTTPATFTIEQLNANGEYSGKIVLEDGPFKIPGTVSGKVTGTEVTVNTEEATSEGTFRFKSTSGTVEPTHNTISGTGEVTIEKNGKVEPVGSGTMSGTLLRTWEEVEKQRARELKEAEEKSARENIRGEWAVKLEYGPEKIAGTAIISAEANSKNEFLSSSALVEGTAPGTFSGTLEGDEATVKITSEASGPYPAAEFTGSKITVSSASDPTSMSGSGTLNAGGEVLEGTQLTATRIKTHQEVVERETLEREAKEKAELEAKEKAEQEAKAKAEQEAKEKAEQEATAKAAQEAKAKAEQEAKVKAEQEAKAKAEREAKEKEILKAPAPAALVSVEPTTKTLTLGSSGTLALGLANHNAYAVQGHLTLSARKGKKATLSFGSASFTIAADGSDTVKVKLSSAARAYLTHHKTLSVSLAISTSTSDMHSAKTYTITLHAPGSGHHKG